VDRFNLGFFSSDVFGGTSSRLHAVWPGTASPKIDHFALRRHCGARNRFLQGCCRAYALLRSHYAKLRII
jgi:hypothetical protein